MGTVTPMDQVLWMTHLLEASLIENSEKMMLWFFGYGSLVWNPGFEFEEKIIGYIKDYKRVFDLACIDHRGTLENLVRTCTLEAKKEEICWGAAFCVRGGIEREHQAIQYLEKRECCSLFYSGKYLKSRFTFQYLEKRECEYDLKIFVDFYKEGNDLEPTVTGVLVFTSTPDNVNNKYYFAPAPLDEMASPLDEMAR